MKLVVIICALAVIVFVAYIGSNVFKSAHPSVNKTVTKIVQKTKTIAKSVSANTETVALPSPPLTCSTNASLVQLSADYVITGMKCTSRAASSNGSSLICNGTILQHATNVTISCTHNYGTISNTVECSGTANTSSSGDLAVNYQCFPPNSLSAASTYSCTGYMANYASLAINLPLSVNCTA